MKNLYAIVFSLLILPVLAQVPDQAVTNCNGVSKSIYSVLASGKVLVVASEGLDCSICKSKAPGLQNFASQNAASIEVWGAMTYTYNNNTPSCTSVNSWVNTYTWSDIFTFVDQNRHWFKSGTPRYLVYDPRDSSIAYEGFSESTAFQTARSLSNTVGMKRVEKKDFSIITYAGELEIRGMESDHISLQLVSLTGQTVKKMQIGDREKKISTLGLTPGIYLCNVSNTKGFSTVRKVYVK